MPRASDEFRAVVVETLRDWRLGQVHIRPDWAREREVFRAGVADIIRLELTAAYLPLFRVIDQIERDIKGIEILALASVLYPKERRTTDELAGDDCVGSGVHLGIRHDAGSAQHGLVLPDWGARRQV